jgi:hypothetical protein
MQLLSHASPRPLLVHGDEQGQSDVDMCVDDGVPPAGFPTTQARGRGMREKSSRHLLEKYQDFVPGQTRFILNPASSETSSSPVPMLSKPPSRPMGTTSHLFEIFQQTRSTQKNEFGLYKRCRAPEEHPYDPEAHFSPKDFCEGTAYTGHLSDQDMYYPFPNRNAFLLGEWRASDENGKGRTGFARLLEIIGSPDWNPADICGVNWARIDDALIEAPNQIQSDDNDENWADESNWRTSAVSISVPFNDKCSSPGPIPYEVQFRHRPIIPLIRDKLMNLKPDDHFHFLPYELRWHPGEGKPDINVYGEMYTSSAFLQAFQELQVSDYNVRL